MIVYATAEDLESWTGNPSDSDPVASLRKASRLVADACRCDMYYTTPDGKPRDDDLREAMRDATCAQVEAWDANGIDPVAGLAGEAPTVTASSIDGGSVSFDSATGAAARTALLTGLCSEAVGILRDVGLGSATV